jgi:hypothetical protein
MSDILKRIQEARGISSDPVPLVEEQRTREALTREADYATYSVETRPWIPGCLNDDDCRRLLAKHRQRERAKLRG